MTSKGRAGSVFVVAALVAIGVGAVVVLREQDDDPHRRDAAPFADASVDGRAKAAKSKPAKKQAGRGGKTRVTGHAGGAGGGGGRGGAHGGGARPSGAREGTDHGDHGGGGAVATGAAHGHHASRSGPSYESALDSNDEHLTMGSHAGPDLTDAQLSAPMSDGSFISECGAPDSMGVTVKVAIKMGRAVGVSVSTNPPAPDVAGCIDHHIRKLSWPASPKLDSLVTTY